jgi:hypothetical protein
VHRLPAYSTETPKNPWTLAFSRPTGWQQMTGALRGTWPQTDRAMNVANADFNKVIAPGAGVNAGFVGACQGPNVFPSPFTLDGNLCNTRRIASSGR